MFAAENLIIEPTPKSMIFENQHCPGPKASLTCQAAPCSQGREADYLRLPSGIKGKKSQDKKNGAFWSGIDHLKCPLLQKIN